MRHRDPTENEWVDYYDDLAGWCRAYVDGCTTKADSITVHVDADNAVIFGLERCGKEGTEEHLLSCFSIATGVIGQSIPSITYQALKDLGAFIIHYAETVEHECYQRGEDT